VAKILGPLFSAQASGPAAGISFLRSGSSTRAGSRPGNSWPLTIGTSQTRANFQLLVGLWKNLDAADRATWSQPELGSEFAWQNFLSCNMRLLSCAQPAIGAAPTPRDLEIPAIDTAIWDDENPLASVLFWTPPAGGLALARLLVASSSLNRSSIDRRKYVQVAWTDTDQGGIQLGQTKPAAHVFWILEYVDPNTGKLLGHAEITHTFPDPYAHIAEWPEWHSSMTTEPSRLSSAQRGLIGTR